MTGAANSAPCRILLSVIAIFATDIAQTQVRSKGSDVEIDQGVASPTISPQVKIRSSQVGQVADSSVGRVGLRQTRDEIARGTRPMTRIESRIQNRIHSRIDNRIDRSYDPQAAATSPYAAAEDRIRAAGESRR